MTGPKHSKNKNIESIYPLSPMQEGMLFHSLYAPESGVYFEQLVYTISGNLNISAFKQAWQRVVDRHAALRTLFIWENLKKPLQIVQKQVNLPWPEYNWQLLSSTEQEKQLENLLTAEQKQGFKLDQAPLMRFILIQINEDTFQFIWNSNHLLIDGWSTPIVLKEAFAFYEVLDKREDVFLEPARPYEDYIDWLQKQDLSQAEAFWRQTLKGFTAPTPLVLDQARKNIAHQHGTYDEYHFQLSAKVTSALQSLPRQQHFTLSTLVQGAWALLLSRYSGETDVVFGATVSGRPPALSGAESMVGMFINTLPVRVQLSGESGLLPLLRQLQTQQVEREQYSYSPLVKIQEWSEVPRGGSLFESILVFENYPVDTFLQNLVLGDNSLKILNRRSIERTNYPLTIAVMPGKNLSVKTCYNTDLFSRDAIIRLAGHFQTLLEGIVADPEQRVLELPLLTETERHQIVVEWNDTASEYPRDRCIHELFETQAERTPDAIAVAGNGRQLSYADLNRRANQLAHYLKGEGVGPEVFVGVYMERSPEMVVGLLGILKSGGAYVPLDPAHPGARVAFMMKEAGMGILLTQGDLVDTLPAEGMRVISLERDWPKIAQEGTENPINRAAVDHLAYLIYTSGSTGRPKGIQVEHGSLLNLVFWHQRAFGVSAWDRATQVATPAFDASVWELWPYLTAGASIHIPDDETRGSAEGLRDWLVTEGLTISFLPTPLAEMMLSLEWPSEVPLRTLLTGGDKLHQRPGPGLPFDLVNNYGPTENTVVTTSGVVAPVDGFQGVPSIGRPIANVQTYVLDRYLKPVPIGVAGELHIGGDGLARGYLNRPDLTLEAFISNPFSNDPGARLYKTGDLARYLPDGNIEFIGRIDHQVKIRGFRIELGEIEVVLNEHPEVQESVVLTREDASGNPYLAAYIVPSEGSAPTVKELRTYLKKKLPEYMVPSAFVTLEAFPLIPSGKVDRKALPAPDVREQSEVEYVEPRTPVEETVARIWSELLGVDRIGVHDNFFELGGHSLRATQAISRLSDTFQTEIPLRAIFEKPSVAGLAELIETVLWASDKKNNATRVKTNDEELGEI